MYFCSSGKMAETRSMKQDNTSKSQGTKDAPFSSKDLSYLNKLPSIAPNYGRKHYSVCYILKSKISRVLLYDNITQQRMLDRKLNLLGGEQRRVMQLLDYHRKSFENQKNLKHKRLAFHARSPVTQFEETKRVQPDVMTEGYQQQRLPKILSGCSSFSSALNPSVSSQGTAKYSPLPHDKEFRACSQAYCDQMTKSDGSLTRNVENSNGDNNNNFADSAPVLSSCKSQAKEIKMKFSNYDSDIRFVSLEKLLSPMDKNTSSHIKCQVTFPMKTKGS